MNNLFQLDRRALLQRALMLAGAAALLGGPEAIGATAESQPRMLDQRRFDLLSAVADTIVPRTDTVGAVEVGVPAQFDGLLRNWAAPATRAQLVNVLDDIDGAARKALGVSFVDLEPAKRTAVLSAYDAAALKPPAAPADPLGKAPSAADPETGKIKQEPVQNASSAFQTATVANPGYAKLKELIVVLYYYSEPALTQELVYEHAPGEWRPSIPLTPETRAYGGASYL